MNCETTRQRLLQCEYPDRPPADLEPHLAECAACRAWQRHLWCVERAIPKMPVPDSTPFPSLLRRIRDGSPLAIIGGGDDDHWWVNNEDAKTLQPAAVIDPKRSDPRPPRPTERTRSKVALAVGLGTGLLLFVAGWILWPRTTEKPTQQRPVVVRKDKERLDSALAKGRSPKERVQLLDSFATRLAADLEEKVRSQSKPDEIRDSAALYVHAIRERLPELASKLPREERAAVLADIAAHLERTESEMRRLASETGEDNSAVVAASLTEVADAAQDGQNQLLAMLREV